MFTNLHKVMKSKRISTKAIAQLIGTTEKTVNNKIKGKTEFTLSEILSINENLFPEYELRFLFRESKQQEDI